MGLQSRLFGGDPKLEAAAVSHPAHIQPGAVGEHVGRIQQALIKLDGATIDPSETAAMRYGPSTANAVLSYKKKRSIINRSYQAQADNIVGIMTMAALDKEMLQKEKEQSSAVTIETIVCRWVKEGQPGRGGAGA